MSVNRRGSPTASTYDIMLVQETMHAAGLYDGPIDGVAGAKTRLAVRRYKRRHGLPVDETLESDFLQHLRQTI